MLACVAGGCSWGKTMMRWQGCGLGLLGVGVLTLAGCGDVPAPAPTPTQRAARPAATNAPQAAPKKAVAPADPRAFAGVPQALEALLAAIQKNDVAAVAKAEGWFALQGESAASSLATIVKDDQAELEKRLTAARALGRVGPPGGAALLGCVSVEPQQLQLRVIESLSRVKPTSPAIVGRLRSFANEGDARVRQNALTGLARIGPGAKEVVPDLQRILNDPMADETLRGEAGKALKAIDPRKGLMGVAK